MKIGNSVSIPLQIPILFAQIPSILGAVRGIEDFNGNIQDGWAGYGIGMAYAQIGTVIGLIFIWLAVIAIEKRTKD